MQSNTCYRVNKPRVVHEIIDNEVVIIDFETGSYYSLNGAGADIWALLEHGALPAEIVDNILLRYESPRPGAEQAVNQLLKELQKQSLITSTPGGTSSGPKPAPESRPAKEKTALQIPTLNKYTDMQNLLLLDPIHDTDSMGWPNLTPGAQAK